MGVSIMPDSKIWAIDTCQYWQGLHNSMVTETDMVSTQKVGKKWRNRRTKSNFIWGQILQGFGRGMPALLCFWRTWEARSPTPSVPPSASTLLWEPYVTAISENLQYFDFGYLLYNSIGEILPKCNASYIIFF